jgi:hypothetical protein
MSLYINDTNSPVEISRWAIIQETFDETDARWIVGFGMRVHVDRPTHTFDTHGGGKHTIAGKPRIEVITKTDKQRDMLVLKYGQSAVLLSREFVLPNSTSYNEVRW